MSGARVKVFCSIWALSGAACHTVAPPPPGRVIVPPTAAPVRAKVVEAREKVVTIGAQVGRAMLSGGAFVVARQYYPFLKVL